MTVECFDDPLSTRRSMAQDGHRPNFHFLPPCNWMNDPNGLCYWQGRYHLFYQFNPYGANWGFIHWGHASSPDLVHWADHPIALTPEAGSGDDMGCFSGCLVTDGDKPTAIYTGFVDFFNTPVLIARARDDELIGWEKSPHNPVIPEKPEGVNETDFRDPYVWRWGDGWQMVIGAGMQDGESAALLYESADLLTWSYCGPLYKTKLADDVKMWECPNFFPLDGKFVLLVSLYPENKGVYYYTGEYDGRKFTPETEGYLEHNAVFFAPQVRQFSDARTILFAWLLEGRSDEAMDEAGWAGVQAIPRELALDADGRLVSVPIREVTMLHGGHETYHDIRLVPEQPSHKLAVGRRLDLEVGLEGKDSVVRLNVLASPDESEATEIGCDLASGEVWLDTTHASLSGSARGEIQRAHLPDGPRESIKIRILIDNSVVEVWFDDTLSMTGRAYPTRENARGVTASVGRHPAVVHSFDVWTMEAIWPTGDE
jgi:beta-fructofuranosidase